MAQRRVLERRGTHKAIHPGARRRSDAAAVLTMNTSEILSRLGIELRNTGAGNRKTVCPRAAINGETSATPASRSLSTTTTSGGIASTVDSRAPNLTKLLDRLTPSISRSFKPGGSRGRRWRVMASSAPRAAMVIGSRSHTSPTGASSITSTARSPARSGSTRTPAPQAILEPRRAEGREPQGPPGHHHRGRDGRA
jgi:hypothetical protein